MRNDFSLLKRKLLTRAIAIMAVAAVLAAALQFLIIDGVLEAPFANAFVSICRKLAGVDRDTAVSMYQRIFRDNKAELLMAGLLALTLVVFYYSLSTLTRYFKEVSNGIEKLAVETADEIKLSPELKFMEQKLNGAKNALRRRDEEKRDAERRKDELVMYLAHDIRTPLTSVLGYLGLLKDTPGLPPGEREKYVAVALDKANRLEQLVNEFFEIVRYSSRDTALDMAQIDLHYLLLQLADEFYPQTVSAGKRITVRSEGNLSLRGDADKLARAFNNILKNAVAYSYDGSTIEIIAIGRAGISVTVRNYGPDIPARELKAVFEKHRRLDAARSSSTGGAGLGLAIAKGIVELHGGSIHAESGGGATSFIVLLPQ